MAPNGFRFEMLRSAHPLSYSAQKLNQLETDLVSTARRWAVDEVRAVIGHQLNDPLTALLLYLHEIKERVSHSAGIETTRGSLREVVDNALQEAERICAIMERMSHSTEAPVDAETAVARGRDAIDAWTRRGSTEENSRVLFTSRHSSHRALTPREHGVLDLIVRGASNKEGAHQLGITTRTFEVHRAHIMEKLGAKNAADLVRMALSESR